MSRPDASLAVLAVLLLLAAASAAGVAPERLVLSADGFLALVTALVATFAAVVAPSVRGGGPRRVVEVLALGAPFLAFGVVASPTGSEPAWGGLALAAAAGFLVSAAPSRARTAVAGVAACALVVPGLLASAGASPAPREFSLVPPTVEASLAYGDRGLDARDLVPAAWRRDGDAAPLRRATLARIPDDPGAAWRRCAFARARFTLVPEGVPTSLPVDVGVVRVLGPAPHATPTATPQAAPETADGPRLVLGGDLPLDALDLAPYDAVFLPTLLGTDDAGFAAAVDGYVRGGGTLVATAHPATWPGELARRLGAAAAAPATASADSEAGFVRHGLGRVRRADLATVREALRAAGPAPTLTAFDRTTRPPPAPSAFPRWAARPADARAALAVLAALVATAFAVGRLAGVARLAAVTSLAALTTFGVVSLGRRPAPVRVQPFAIDLGGPGGRRIEGAFLSAGPAGWTAVADPPGDLALWALGVGAVEVEGGRARLHLGPLAQGYVLSSAVAVGARPGEARTSTPPAWARSLLDLPPASRRAAGLTYVERRWAGPGPVPPGDAWIEEGLEIVVEGPGEGGGG